MQWRIENWFGERPVFICIPTASLEPTDRINYRRSVVINGIAHDYIVVVVTEKAFPSFIESLETECDRIALAIHKKRKLFKAAQRKFADVTEEEALNALPIAVSPHMERIVAAQIEHRTRQK
jgi:hypothetical protein